MSGLLSVVGPEIDRRRQQADKLRDAQAQIYMKALESGTATPEQSDYALQQLQKLYGHKDIKDLLGKVGGVIRRVNGSAQGSGAASTSPSGSPVGGGSRPAGGAVPGPQAQSQPSLTPSGGSVMLPPPMSATPPPPTQNGSWMAPGPGEPQSIPKDAQGVPLGESPASQADDARKTAQAHALADRQNSSQAPSGASQTPPVGSSVAPQGASSGSQAAPSSGNAGPQAPSSGGSSLPQGSGTPSQAPSPGPSSVGGPPPASWSGMVATAFPDPAKVRQTAFDQQLKLEQAKGLIEIKKKEIEAQAKATERGARPLGSARQVVGEDGKPHWVQFIQDPNGRVIKEDLGEAPSSTQKLDSTQQLARDLHSEDKSTSEIAQAKLTKLLQPPKTSASRSSKGGSSAGPSGIAIPDDALRTLARREITQGLKPSFGLSAKDPNRAKYNRILAEEYAKDPDAASALADYKSGTSSLMQLQKLKAQIGSFDKAFNSDLANAREASEAVSRSDVRRFNSWQQFVQADLTDNPKLAQLRVAAQTAVNQYARLMYSATGGGTSTDSARKDAESLLSSAMAKGSFNAALAQMEKEAKNRIAGINDQISDQQEQMNKRSPGASKLSPPSPKGPPPKTADEYLKSLTQ